MVNQRLAWTLSMSLGLVLGGLASCVVPAPPATTEECTDGELGCACSNDMCAGDLVCIDGTCFPEGTGMETTGGDGDGDGDLTGDGDGDSGDGDGEPACAPEPLQVSGSIETSIGEGTTITFDSVEAEVTHKQDIDPDDGDGCINHLKLIFSASAVDEGADCVLEVEAWGNINNDSNELSVRSMSFESSNQCEGFADIIEGSYTGVYANSGPGSILGSTIELSNPSIDEINVSESCIVGNEFILRPQGSLLEEDGIKLLTELGGEVYVTGNVESLSDPQMDWQCPVVCGDGEIDPMYEVCEPELETPSCADLGAGEAGQVTCHPLCIYDTSACFDGLPSSGLYQACSLMEPCEGGFECVEGMCTLACAEDVECEAEIFGVPSCNLDTGYCDLACLNNSDCPDGLSCDVDGYCMP